MKRFLVMGAIALGMVLVVEKDADACGGCFAPTENPTVVNDHRMILTISPDRSTSILACSRCFRSTVLWPRPSWRLPIAKAGRLAALGEQAPLPASTPKLA